MNCQINGLYSEKGYINYANQKSPKNLQDCKILFMILIKNKKNNTLFQATNKTVWT